MRGALFISVLVACGVQDLAVPPGKLAVVGARVFGHEDIEALQGELSAYAQVRFRGPEGTRDLLQALIDSELMAQEARAQGLEHDPRVVFELWEEVADQYVRAELERRVPYESIAADGPALAAYYAAHRDDFRTAETRSVKGVFFRRYPEAMAALRQVQLGVARLEDFGPLAGSKPVARDDTTFVGYARVVFDPALHPGDLLPAPVVMGSQVLVGTLGTLEPSVLRPLQDPDVRDAVIQAVRALRLAEAKTALVAELRAKGSAS